MRLPQNELRGCRHGELLEICPLGKRWNCVLGDARGMGDGPKRGVRRNCPGPAELRLSTEQFGQPKQPGDAVQFSRTNRPGRAESPAKRRAGTGVPAALLLRWGACGWPPACCPPTLNTDVTKDFGYYLSLPRMTLYAVADGMALQRLPRTSVDFATLGGSGTGTVVLSTSDFNYDYQAAGRILVGATLGDCFQVEGLYWRMTTAEDTEAVRDATPNAVGGVGNLFSPFRRLWSRHDHGTSIT